ncbi:Uncharacterised protein [Mycobacteroides abscessus]|nr:Uncharacterised protein [Mycobacteroides abscessus]
MRIATITRMIRRDQKFSEATATSLSAMTMISALRMKSVRTALDTTESSSTAFFSVFVSTSAWCRPETSSHSFSAPSNARYVPPSMSSGVSRKGRNWLSSRIAGRMKSSLLRSDPVAMRLMTGSSRLAARPST